MNSVAKEVNLIFWVCLDAADTLDEWATVAKNLTSSSISSLNASCPTRPGRVPLPGHEIPLQMIKVLYVLMQLIRRLNLHLLQFVNFLKEQNGKLDAVQCSHTHVNTELRGCRASTVNYANHLILFATVIYLAGCSPRGSSAEALARLDRYERVAFDRYVIQKSGKSADPRDYSITESEKASTVIVEICPIPVTENDKQTSGGELSSGSDLRFYLDKGSKHILRIEVGT